MPYLDPDNANPSLVAELVRIYEASAARLKQIVLHPPGSTVSARTFSRARAADQLAQVNAEIARLKKSSADWTGKALKKSVEKGLAAADKQARAAGLILAPGESPGVSGSFDLIDKRAIEILARDTYDNLEKAADSIGRTASSALRKMADNGLTAKQVNDILAGAIIEGKPKAAILSLQKDLEKIHGQQVTIINKAGDPMTFDTDYYARMVANTRMRQATVTARHQRLIDHGADLVKIIGLHSKNPCTLLLGHIFSISGHHPKYPAFDTVSHGQPPYKLFHPNCSKSTAPFIEGLSKDDLAEKKDAA